MCEACKLAQRAAVQDLVDKWKARPANPGAVILAKMLELGEIDERSPADRQHAVNQLMLDSYESQRRDAISIGSMILVAFTMMKNRILEEASSAGDKRIVNLTWDGERNGYHMVAKDRAGNVVSRFEGLAFGENPGQAAVRITLGHLGEIGEIHE